MVEPQENKKFKVLNISKLAIDIHNNCEKPEYDNMAFVDNFIESVEEREIMAFLHENNVETYNMNDRKDEYFKKRKKMIFMGKKESSNPSILMKKRLLFKHSHSLNEELDIKSKKKESNDDETECLNGQSNNNDSNSDN